MILPFIYKKSIVLSLRSSHRRNSLKKLFLKISQNSQENTCARASFLIKVFLHRCFPVNFANFLRTPFLQNTSGRLLRKHVENCYIKRHHVYFNLLWLFWISLSMNIFFLIIVSFIIVTRQARALHDHNKL